MNCRHCQQWNPEEQERCRVCGGNLRAGNDSGEWQFNTVKGTLAAAPQRARAPQPQVHAAAASVSTQRDLFAERPASNVIPFESLPGGARAAMHMERPSSSSAPKLSQRKVARKPVEQAQLDFLPPAPVTPRTLKTKVEASIFCDAPVATPTHRLFAAAVDTSLVLLLYALCVGSYWFMGGELPVNRLGYGIFAAGFALIAMLYGLVWALGNTETAGMRCARLKLTNFDGFPPEAGQRLWRYFGTCLSFATCGFGLLWALADEENLAWQDHISKTFPTFQRVETNFCKGR